MVEREITMTELRQNLAVLINQAAYGHERIVLVSHGQPKAAIIGLAELHALQQAVANGEARRSNEVDDFLSTAATLRQRISEWRETYQVPTSDSTALLREMREEWDGETDDLR
jgi:prevent-host-death family protein